MTKPGPFRIVQDFLEWADLPAGPAHECPYLPDRQACNVGFLADELDSEIYQGFMDHGFRRSGQFFYRPQCSGCRECVPIRVPTDGFRASRSQKRVWRRNQDLAVQLGPPRLTREKWSLFSGYINARHPEGMEDSYEMLESFLYQSPVRTTEILYTLNGALIGVSIVDIAPESMSSVYMFFDPQHADRSLGTFSTLWEIEHCRGRGIAYYYLGYYIADCDKMNYKNQFRPLERLHPQHGWIAAL